MEKSSMDALNRLSPEAFRQAEKTPLVLVLDNIRSGLNVGSVFRSADAFALEKLVLCGITVQPPHREVLKTALGSTDTVCWEYMENTLDAVQQLRRDGYQVWAVEQTDPKTWLQDLQPDKGQRLALVLGNEVDGVDAEVLQHCHGALEIPQFGTKHSLNVAVAAGIAVWELTRKMRLFPEAP
jgi:23S rRNA (guanosine2251-2'-O)-methyltransferase